MIAVRGVLRFVLLLRASFDSGHGRGTLGQRQALQADPERCPRALKVERPILPVNARRCTFSQGRNRLSTGNLYRRENECFA